MHCLVSRQKNALQIIREVDDLLLGELSSLSSVLRADLEADIAEHGSQALPGIASDELLELGQKGDDMLECCHANLPRCPNNLFEPTYLVPHLQTKSQVRELVRKVRNFILAESLHERHIALGIGLRVRVALLG